LSRIEVYLRNRYKGFIGLPIENISYELHEEIKFKETDIIAVPTETIKNKRRKPKCYIFVKFSAVAKVLDHEL